MDNPAVYPPPPPYDSHLVHEPSAHDNAPMIEKGAAVPAAQQRAAEPLQRQERNMVRDLITVIFCLLIPPIAIALQNGPRMKLNILLNVLLCIIGWVPGILHAVWYCFFYVK